LAQALSDQASADPHRSACGRFFAMGNSINKIDEGLFICGVDALRDYDRLRRLGIKCVLNAAQNQLYRDGLSGITDDFEVLIIGAEDCTECNLSVHFEEIADFIEAGRQKGGVVVHCAAGVSRACTSCIAYLMIKEHWDLNTAFRRVQAVRRFVHPNAGFWRQLRDLEASLVAQGVHFRTLAIDQMPPRPEQPEDSEATPLPMAAEDPLLVLQELDREAARTASFITKYLTARLVPKEGVAPEAVVANLQGTSLPGVTWEHVVCGEADVEMRVGLAANWHRAGLQAALAQIAGAQAVECEDSS